MKSLLRSLMLNVSVLGNRVVHHSSAVFVDALSFTSPIKALEGNRSTLELNFPGVRGDFATFTEVKLLVCWKSRFHRSSAVFLCDFSSSFQSKILKAAHPFSNWAVCLTRWFLAFISVYNRCSCVLFALLKSFLLFPSLALALEMIASFVFTELIFSCVLTCSCACFSLFLPAVPRFDPVVVFPSLLWK